MNEPLPMPRDTRIIDNEHLRLLSIFHFVGAGLALLALMFLTAHFALMHAVLSNPKFTATQPNPSSHAVLEIFVWIYAIFGAWFLASLVLNVFSGVFLLKKRHRIFSMAVAALNCVHVPFGTILGVFTLVVLLRESVMKLYEEQRTQAGVA